MDRAENGVRNSDHGLNSDHCNRTIIVVRKYLTLGDWSIYYYSGDRSQDMAWLDKVTRTQSAVMNSTVIRYIFSSTCGGLHLGLKEQIVKKILNVFVRI